MIDFGGAADSMIRVIGSPNHSTFRFEWHPTSKKLYIVHLSTTPHQGELIAIDVKDHGMAINYVNLYLRGYQAGKLQIPVRTADGDFTEGAKNVSGRV